jgi:phosphoserine phosphatase
MREAKRATLERLAAGLGLPLAACAAVGDGANDLAMLGAAGLGVAYRAKPVMAAAARARLDHAELTGLLYAQGFPRAAFRDG